MIFIIAKQTRSKTQGHNMKPTILERWGFIIGRILFLIAAMMPFAVG